MQPEVQSAETIAEHMVPTVQELADFLRQAQEPPTHLPWWLRAEVRAKTAVEGWAIRTFAYPVLIGVTALYEAAQATDLSRWEDDGGAIPRDRLVGPGVYTSGEVVL